MGGLHLLLLICFFFFHLPSNSLGTNETDMLALLSFKSLISNSPFKVLSSWNETLHYCQWQGVRCGNRHPNRVTALSLDSLSLSGHISPSLANLTFLKSLDLSNNQLTGNIPAELGHLSRLQFLNLSVNNLVGNIPSTLGNCSNLEFLHLTTNNLQGTIPSNLMQCKKLRILSLSSNSLVGGIPPQFDFLELLEVLDLGENNFTESIPSTLGNLTHLFVLYIYENNFDGFIPPSLGQLKALKYLHLGQNNLSGKIPHSIYNLSAMVELDFSGNQLDGNLPSNFCDAFQNLQYLYLFKNQLNGQIPISISNCSAMINIELFLNNFRGTIPYSIGTLQNLSRLDMSRNHFKATGNDWKFFDSLINCTFLQILELGENQLQGRLPGSIANLSTSLNFLGLNLNPISGSIPAEVGKLTNLNILELGGTFIEGTIPKEIGNLVNLEYLGLTENMLSGEIPSILGNLTNLEYLGLTENMLSGEIPSTLGNLTRMNMLHLENNAFTGSIPEELSNMQILTTLNLSNNKLIGSIPKKLFNLPSLSILLDLSNNYLNGSLPPEIGQLKNVVEVYLSNNKLSGQIPSTIDGCQLLQILHLDGNLLNGSIPLSLSSMIGLQDLDISNNALSGPVPEFIGQMKLQYLNISFNNFEGELPKDGVFRNSSAVDIRGNSKLCGGIPEMNLPKCVLDNRRKMHYSKIIIVITCCIGGIICLCISMFLIARFCWKKGYQNNLLPFVAKTSEYQKVSYNDILRATDHFSLENLIGRGTFGAVYKAPMKFENVTNVAVKVLNLKQHGASRSFLSECEVLRKVRHRNLIKVISSCSSIDHHGNDFKALIFEFMPNGSLETWLHPGACTNRPFRSLSLIQRLNIAIDVATALDYLHNHGSAPIVHCDLKPSNVLLDEDMTAHVGDFGLARFLVQPDSMSSLLTGSTTGLRGSIGYIPPEYGMGSQASVEGDAYSYGILVLEMFTGVSPTDERFRDGLSLHMHVEMAFSHHVTEIIDHKLFPVNDVGDNLNPQDVHDCLVSVIRCGLLCSKLSPKERNGIKEVLKELNWARVKLLR